MNGKSAQRCYCRGPLIAKTLEMKWLAAPVLALFMGCGVNARAQVTVADFSGGLDTNGAPRGWQLRERAGRAVYSVVNSEGVHALKLCSESASFAFQRLVKADLKQ